LLFWVLGIPTAALANLDAAEADALVRARWFEGVPADRIEPLTPDAVTRLGVLLADSAERQTHAPALELLGRAGADGAYELVAEYAADVPSGEVDRAIFRARLAIPLALGYLARRDDRALWRLIEAAGVGAAPASWHRAQLDGVRSGVLRQKMAITGLALSGRPEAGVTLRQMGAQVAPSPVARGRSGDFADLRAHLDEACALSSPCSPCFSRCWPVRHSPHPPSRCTTSIGSSTSIW
jgi:hypothetical protein